ncbi:hypothetical protein OED01_07425 [Microbacterium sp. M28]|uniref:hypothetical protein n=1 Tax=Microbacterium sp. M28 TaxID=2962064 RepID=UPI0021F4CB90|nr:hypothetical protein [Microbacterium sp. M28]UYO98528.1 hypothetical protein OED01_07425 [Microbacterium sp. M28]
MTDTPGTPEEESGEAMPSDAELAEPSTEKDPAEEPHAPERAEDEPSHEAVGIGIVGRPQVEPEPDDEA